LAFIAMQRADFGGSGGPIVGAARPIAGGRFSRCTARVVLSNRVGIPTDVVTGWRGVGRKNRVGATAARAAAPPARSPAVWLNELRLRLRRFGPGGPIDSRR